MVTEQEARSWLESESSTYRVTTDDHYVIALSAKYVGATDPQLTAANGTHTFMFRDIVAEFQSLRSRFGSDVHLVKSTSFGKQNANANVPAGESIYVTVYDPGTFLSKEAGQAWCARNFPDLSGASLDNVCLPRVASVPH
ncbi:hypothetical protein [Raineyella fluvialis]|uniref:Uncharacterized protein n=1 Tax=Raineyella fluvialis TaxID=2662261 RepID=A0A5Q2FF94_9ACTN|nr:hypothetical protein [Raineyella fluvialis]QGF23375.1 hypothetical protein Rai3103_06540 [Raineyella fluvialis]